MLQLARIVDGRPFSEVEREPTAVSTGTDGKQDQEKSLHLSLPRFLKLPNASSAGSPSKRSTSLLLRPRPLTELSRSRWNLGVWFAVLYHAD